MQRERTVSSSDPVSRSSGLTLLVVVVVGSLGILAGAGYERLGGVIVALAIVLISIPILARQARREEDRQLLWLLVLALSLKLCGAIVRHFVAFDVYGGVADAAGYHGWGERIAERFRDGRFVTGLDGLTGSNFIRFFTGLLYTVIGPTRLGGFFVYSWLGFWGLFLFYRAFTIAVPEGSRSAYAKLVFFLPSLLFWPSSIGKEAWMMFTLGIAAFGVARALSGRTLRGLAWVALGLWLAGLVRPHIAGMMALALVVGALLRRPHPELRQLAAPAKVVALAAVAVVSVFVLDRAEGFLQDAEEGSGRRGVDAALAFTSTRTGTGGSEFQPSVLDSPGRAPLALATVLYRPFVFEASNDQMMASALETGFLLGISLVRIRWVRAAIGSVRRQAYVGFAAAYLAASVVAFSSIANFGILARQRVQFLPFFLVLLCVGPKERDAGRTD